MFYGLFAWQLLVTDFDKEADHFADLMVDETLTDESKPYEGHSMHLAFFLVIEAFLEVLVDHLLFDQFCTHGDDEPITSRIVSLVSLGKVMEVVSAEVESDQMIQFCNYLFSLQFIQHPLSLVILLTQEQLQWRDVIIHPGACIMPHIKSLTQLLNRKDPDIER